MTAAAPSTKRRMTKDERREQLLDVAAEVVLADGPGSVTMERIAEAAGVSKALPYNHFENIDRLLVTLYRRESVILGAFIWDELEHADPDADLFRVHITSYFDGLERRGDILGALTVPGSSVATSADPRNDGPRFAGRLLRRFHGVEATQAKVLSSIVHSAVVGAGNTWRMGLAPRPIIEDAAVHLLRAAVAWEGPR